MPDPIPANLAQAPDALAFRRVLGRFATGVCVVSLARPDGGIGAMTVNSLVSVSLDPMLVSWSLQNSSSHFDEFAGAQDFAFSILAENQQALARRYAARGDAVQVAGDFVRSASGLPVIAGALAHIECRRWAVHAAGDHTLILGQVTALAAHDAARPLTFYGGQFGGLKDTA